jgi:hypothetical protein
MYRTYNFSIKPYRITLQSTAYISYTVYMRTLLSRNAYLGLFSLYGMLSLQCEEIESYELEHLAFLNIFRNEEYFAPIAGFTLTTVNYAAAY